MVELYKKFKDILIYEKGFLYLLCSFYVLTIPSNLYSINYEKSFFKKDVRTYPIESRINGIDLRSYIIYGMDKIEDIVDSKILKRFFIVGNKDRGAIEPIYMYPKSKEEDIVVVINSFDLKTESFKIISFFRKNFIESFTKKNISYQGRLNLSDIYKDINIYSSISYKINDISIYTHLIHSKKSNILNKITSSLKRSGYINLSSSFKDSSTIYSIWKSQTNTYNKDSIVYLEYFSNQNHNSILSSNFINLDNKFETEMNIYEIF